MSYGEGRIDLRIEKAIYGGSGLARDQGRAIFVPFTLPGEYVTAIVTSKKASFAEAALDAVIEPSTERVQAPCPYFGVCGGCHYQHAAYPAQVAIKAAILEETLTRAGLRNLPEMATHTGEPFHYRNRIRLHLDPVTSALGYRERGSHRLLNVDACPIAAPELEQALAVLGPLYAAHNCAEHFSQVELSVNHDGSELLLALWLRQRASASQAASTLSRICEALSSQMPALRGGGVLASVEEVPPGPRQRGARKPRTPRHMETEGTTEALVATWGTPSLTYRAAGLDYRVSLGAFFQVNRTLVDELVRLATLDRSGKLAWDLYAGVGLFSRVLAQSFDRVVAVEGAPISFGDLQTHLKAPHRAVRAGTLDFLRGEIARRDGARPDFVLVDPPRAGLGAEVTSLLSRIRPPDITYVSCDPATLGRDLGALLDSGYKLQQLHLIDLFPQTFHLETLALLSLA